MKKGFPRPAVLLLCMLVLLCGLSFPCPAAAAEKDLTLMIYMAGSDLETQNFQHLMQCPTCDPPARRR